ncbi:MAG: LytTR family DNA-binding domain-containing protein [Lachnospiraceae bacterium]|nr:LytTR family DNA-binding domain-containing protein [Lachnospiraceae bacterium]
MYRIGICDDEIYTCADLEQIIGVICCELSIKASIEPYYSGRTLIKYLNLGNDFDILFLDIELPDIDGINIGKYIRDQNNNHKMQIIYISSKKNYAMRLFKNQPSGFLVKPLKIKEVKETMKISLRRIDVKKGTFRYKKGHEFHFADCSDIIYLSSTKNKIEIVLNNGQSDIFYGKLSNVPERLPDNFSLIHKSYLVNRDYIKLYSYDKIKMVNGEDLPVSIPHRNNLRIKMQGDRMNDTN